MRGVKEVRGVCVRGVCVRCLCVRCVRDVYMGVGERGCELRCIYIYIFIYFILKVHILIKVT